MKTLEQVTASWGAGPVLFRLGRLDVPSYGMFMAAALIVGLLLYAVEARRNRAISGNTFYILLAAVFGGALGAKIPIAVVYWREIFLQPRGWEIILTGRSIMGGLVGGALAIFVVKRMLGMKERRGNLFAPGIAAGMAIGRAGCFLRGCCYGTATALPWGVDLGDGVLRHPTQLYESVFMLSMYAVISALRNRAKHPAALFWMLMISYSAFRFAVEFIRVEETWFLGLSLFQWICLALMVVYGRLLVVEIAIPWWRLRLKTSGKAL